MANLISTVDAAFYDFGISTPTTLDGVARLIPGDPVPLDGSRASKVLRFQQMSRLTGLFPFGLVPGYYPYSYKDLGNHTLQSSLKHDVTDYWWLGLIGQLRPQKIVSAIKADILKIDWQQPPFVIAKNNAKLVKYFFDKSVFTSIGLCSRLYLGSSTFLQWGTEKHVENKRRRSKAVLHIHQLPWHDVALEAAWPELFVDQNGKYWDVPKSISLNCSSNFPIGLKYRFGIHKNDGCPQAADFVDGVAPLSLMPGLCAKAALSFEKSVDLWRAVTRMKTRAYDSRLDEPHAAISGIIGNIAALRNADLNPNFLKDILRGTCTRWFGERENLVESTDNGNSISMGGKKRSTFSTDTFGSVGATIQLGKFKRRFMDLTRVDARLDFASGFSKKIFRKDSVDNEENLLASPRLSVIFHQQVFGPLYFRIDSRLSLDTSVSLRDGLRESLRNPHVEDVIYSLNCAVRKLGSGRVVAWYSPRRKEGMVELRVFEI